jgi:hypothetical protein
LNTLSLPTRLLCLTAPALLAAACLGFTPADDDDDNAGTGGVGGSSAASGGSGGTTGGSGGTGGSSGGAGGATGGAGAPSSGGQGGSSVSTGGAGALAGQGSGAAGGSSGTGGTTAGSAGQAGSAGAPMTATGGMPAVGGAGASAGMAGSSGTTGDGTLGNGVMSGMGSSSKQYETVLDISRNDVPYILITNGWGPGFESHTIAWNGTSFIVEMMNGSRGSGGQPASYPTVFCGKYSVMQVPDCGLPRPIAEIQSLKTGWRWKANDNTGAYNAAYDIWLGTETGFGMYLMVWLRDPTGEQPAGSPIAEHQDIEVANVPGRWDIWSGTVNSRPIINWVRDEGMDSSEIVFDVMDFIRDAQTRGLTITGTQVNAVAVGFEIWQGPITNLQSEDFYVDVK